MTVVLLLILLVGRTRHLRNNLLHFLFSFYLTYLRFGMSASWVTGLFLFFFLFSTCLQLYLSIRQSRAVLLHRSEVPSDFSTTVSLAEHQKAVDYTLAKQRFARWHVVFDALCLLIFTLGGGLNVLAALAGKWAFSPLTQGVLLVGLFVIVNSVLSLPFEWYRTFRLEARFGFNQTTLTTFFSDRMKGAILLTIIGIPLMYGVIYLMGIGGVLWWFWVWLFWLGFSLLLLWVFPKWIAPWFNQFRPLEDANLNVRIEQLLVRTGFKSKGIFVMDGSKRSGHANAYFTGLGKNKRIVFFDTLLKDMQPTEVEAVLAHELGHFKYQHILKQMLIQFGLTLTVLFILGLLISEPAFYQGLGVQYASHAMALLLFLLVLPVFTLPFTPLASFMSRKNEFEADCFAAQHTSADDLIQALVKLYRNNATSLISDKWYSLFYDSHPNAQERVTALRQSVWQQNQVAQ